MPDFDTCVSKLSKDIDEHIRIRAARFNVRRVNADYIFIIWEIHIKDI